MIARIAKMTARDGGCLVWTGTKNRKGYGVTSVGSKTWPVHRLVYCLSHGVMLPSSVFVCHSCDNPACLNLSHLWAGTASMNSSDMARKGRGMAKMTRDDVEMARRMFSDGHSCLEIARAIGSVSERAVRYAVSGQTFRWLDSCENCG